MKIRSLFIFISLLAVSCSVSAPEELDGWREGYLDIHHIATGRGNCAFIVMPDGTTMVFDAGDLGSSDQFAQKILPVMPSDELLPAEWQARYIRRHMPKSKEDIDYLCFSHFDMDHLGIPHETAPTAPEGYVMSGVTQLGTLMHIGKIVDRGFPDYDFPYKGVLDSTRGELFRNYLDFVKAKNVKVEGFDVGSKDQFAELTKPHSNFSITGIYASGRYWDGTQVKTIDIPEDRLREFDENRCSCTIKITYGDFTYHISGDICSLWDENDPEWKDVEKYVGQAEGQIDAMLANHHSYSGTMSRGFLRATSPQAIVIPTWDYYHPQPEQLANMLDTSLFPGPHLVFTTGMVDTNLERLGENGAKMAGHGHIVFRVYPGGDTFRIFVLDPMNPETDDVLYVSELLHSK